MSVHIIIGILISVFGLLFYKDGVSKDSNKKFVIVSFGLIFLVQTLRSTRVGMDSYRYYLSFLSMQEGLNVRYEPLYVLLNRLAGAISLSPQMLYASCALIIDIGLCFFIIKNTRDGESAFFQVFIWLTLSSYLNSMNLLREYIAISISINAYTVLNIYNNSKKRYIISGLLILAASLFHSVALLTVVMYVPFLTKRVTKKMVFLSLMGIITVFVYFQVLLNYFFAFFPRYETYIDSWRIKGTEGVGGYYIILSFIKLAFVLIVLFLTKSEKYNELIRLSFFVVISIGFYFFKSRTSLALRTGYFFEPFFVLLFPKVLSEIPLTEPSKRIINIIFYVIFWVFFVYLLMGGRTASRGCVPYTFFWQEF